MAKELSGYGPTAGESMGGTVGSDRRTEDAGSDGMGEEDE